MAGETKKGSAGRSSRSVNLDTLGLEVGANLPPQALDVEEAVLGALLIEPNCVDEAISELTPNCFYSEKNKMIFQAMSSLYGEHIPLDIRSVTHKLEAQKNLEAVGGVVALANLTRQISAASHVEYDVRILKQKCIQRELITASYQILKDSYDPSVNVDDLIDGAQSKLFAAISSNIKRDVQQIEKVLQAAIQRLEDMQGKTGLSGVPTGFDTLDSMTLGWQPSDLIILAARPSVGKTAFVLNIARNAAVQFNVPTAIFSLEMSSLQLANRLMVSETGLDPDKIKGGSELRQDEWKQLEVQLARMMKAPLYIDDTPSLPVMEFRSKVKKLVSQKEVRLVIVDYLQLMQGPAELRGLREQEVAAISRTLKATAKEMNIAIIALSQLSRQSENRVGGNRKPQLSDLRESGSIEQDADMVLFIHRYDYQGLSENPDDVGRTDLIIAKHRNGSIGEIPMRFQASQVRFIEEKDGLASTVASFNPQSQTTFESGMNSEAPFGPPPPAMDDLGGIDGSANFM